MSASSSNKDIVDKPKGKYVDSLRLSNHKINLKDLANRNKDANKPNVVNAILYGLTRSSLKTSKLTSDFKKKFNPQEL